MATTTAKYAKDLDRITTALRMVKEGRTYKDASAETGLGESTIERHIQQYRLGNRPEIDVGELPGPRARGGVRKGGAASLVRIQERLSASTHAERMAADAAAMEDEAGRLEVEAVRLRQDAAALRKAAKVLTPPEPKQDV